MCGSVHHVFALGLTDVQLAPNLSFAFLAERRLGGVMAPHDVGEAERHVTELQDDSGWT